MKQHRNTAARATEYVVHGWPVAPLNVPGGNAVAALAGPVIRSPQQAHAVWHGTGYGVALVCDRFAMLDLPPRLGARLNYQLGNLCATATLPGPDMRWHFLVTPGVLPPWLPPAEAEDVVLHQGGNWVPLSPTRLSSRTRAGWLVTPREAHWRPFPLDLACAYLHNWVRPDRG